MKTIKMLTDSACDIPKWQEEKYNIGIMSFPLTVGDESYLERVDFSNKDFYEILQQQEKIPTTSQITPIRFEETFEEIFDDGYEEVIYVCINSKGSSTINSAQMARDSFFAHNPVAKDKFKIHIVDSKIYTYAYGYAVVEAARRIEKGISSKQILAFLQDWFDSVCVCFTPFDLKFVKKSGRVSAAAAFMGELLGLKPVITFIDGESSILQKVRGDKAVAPAMVKIAKENMIPQTPYFLLKADASEENNEALLKQSEKIIGYPPEGIYEVGAAIAINAGCNIVGIIYKGKND